MPKKKILHSQWIDKENKSQREWLVKYIRKSTTATALIPLSRRGEPTKDQIDNCYRKLTEEADHRLESLRHRMERAWNTYNYRTKNNNGVSVQLSQEAKSLATKQSRELGISPSKWIELLILESTALDQDRISALLKAKQNEEKAIQDLEKLKLRVRNGVSQVKRILQKPELQDLNSNRIQECLMISEDIKQTTSNDMIARLKNLIKKLNENHQYLGSPIARMGLEDPTELSAELASGAQKLEELLKEYAPAAENLERLINKCEKGLIPAEKLIQQAQALLNKTSEVIDNVKIQPPSPDW